jgi:hypothetical protein
VLAVGGEEFVLVRPDLLYVKLVEARPLVGPDRFDVTLQVGSARDLRGQRFRCDELRGLLEVGRRRKDLCELAVEAVVRPQPGDGVDRAALVTVETDLQAALDQLSALRVPTELVDGVPIGADGAVAVPNPSREVNRGRAKADTRIFGGSLGRS